MVELMMVSGVPTSSGFEERIRFSELEIVDANAIETGVLSSMPEGNYLNGWDVNIAGVRITTARRNIRQHKHAVGFPWLAWVPISGGSSSANEGEKQEFLLRVKRKGGMEQYIGRRYGDFAKLHKNLRTELPGKVLPTLPNKNKSNTTATTDSVSGDKDSEASSISSVSTQLPPSSPARDSFSHQSETGSRLLSVKGSSLPRLSSRRNSALTTCLIDQRSGRLSPRVSVDGRPSSPGGFLGSRKEEVSFR